MSVPEKPIHNFLRSGVLIGAVGHCLHLGELLVETKLHLALLERLFCFVHLPTLPLHMLRARKQLDPASTVVAVLRRDSAGTAHADRRFGIACQRAQRFAAALPVVTSVIAKMAVSHALPFSFREKRGTMTPGAPKNVVGGLLFAVDQKTGIRRIGRDQFAVVVAGGVEPIAHAPDDVVVFVSHDTRLVAETAGDGTQNLAAFADVPFLQWHFASSG